MKDGEPWRLIQRIGMLSLRNQSLKKGPRHHLIFWKGRQLAVGVRRNYKIDSRTETLLKGGGGGVDIHKNGSPLLGPPVLAGSIEFQ